MGKYLILILALTISGCKEAHDISLDNKSSFTLIVRNIESGTSKQFIFQPDSKEYVLLNKWIQQNKEKWNKEPVKWLSPFEVRGNNYSLLFAKETAVIKAEHEGRHTMWRKKIDSSLVNIFKNYANT